MLETIATITHEVAARVRRRYLLTAEDAEDVAQNALIATLRHLPEVSRLSEERLASWMYVVVRRKCIDLLRNVEHQNRKHSVSYESEFSVLVGSREEELDRSLIRQEGYARLRNILSELLPTSQEVLYLYYFERLSYLEVAALLKVPLGTVKSRLDFAKRRLTKLIRERGLERSDFE